jgi:hypothetical protein
MSGGLIIDGLLEETVTMTNKYKGDYTEDGRPVYECGDKEAT